MRKGRIGGHLLHERFTSLIDGLILRLKLQAWFKGPRLKVDARYG
jgi:hypothetical protein